MKDVSGSDFTDEEFVRFFDAVERLNVQETAPTNDWVRQAAAEFAANPPVPDHDQLRSHIDHAVAVSKGWDHPYDRQLMFDTAVRSFYILAWLEYLQKKRRGDGNAPVDLTLGVKMTFTPVFRGET